MRTGYAYIILSFTLILIPCVSAVFTLKDLYTGQDFFNRWKWETFNDPTHGRVNYVDRDTARAKSLSYGEPSLFTRILISTVSPSVSDSNTFVMRADNTSYVPSGSRGRDSVRISSYDSYDESLIVLDVVHMPEGCSTWPAFWTLSGQGPWPKGGEIDIIEGEFSAIASRCRSG